MAKVGRPYAGEYAPYFERYVSLVTGEDPGRHPGREVRRAAARMRRLDPGNRSLPVGFTLGSEADRIAVLWA